jgi:hypothetical protein
MPLGQAICRTQRWAQRDAAWSGDRERAQADRGEDGTGQQER